MVSAIAMRATGYHFPLDFPSTFADSDVTRRAGGPFPGGALLRYAVYRLLWLGADPPPQALAAVPPLHASMALALAVVGGITLGILAAVYQNQSWDYVSVSVATIGVSVPNFVLGVFMIVLFSFVLPIFPTGGWSSPRDWVVPTGALALGPR